MSTQDKLERVLREIHVMFANSKHLKGDENQILVDKAKTFQLLNQLNVYVYEMMDEHDVTQASKDKIRREAERKGERMILEAEKRAEDVYAASVLYTNESLHHVQESIDRANEEVERILKQTQDLLMSQKETIRENQSELTEQLQDMADAKTYFRLIEERNAQLEKRKAQARKEREQIMAMTSRDKKVNKPEVKVNKDYFERTGMSLKETDSGNEEEEAPKVEAAEVTVNQNANYFKWKNGTLDEDKKKEEEEKEKAKEEEENESFEWGGFLGRRGKKKKEKHEELLDDFDEEIHINEAAIDHRSYAQDPLENLADEVNEIMKEEAGKDEA
ncbi:hypothetical protein [Eubacterium oxidoreducens]|uniref:Uncharacterized protein n=1 Tax=Eubacterium oxidoreducens TaxID=1732 RepID=A0A1G6C7Y7_EUBOX|nr:hypothetical protein [Eubacterium oxidoreducens]SDB29016.1 hypothetical protein SAMN02910417_02168 [Eubacterium oxidoreducens]